MSPAEPYCRACGAAVGRAAVLDLERIDVPTASVPGSTVVSTVAATKERRWSRTLAAVASVGVLAAAVAITSTGDGARNDPPAATPTTVPTGTTLVPAPTTTIAVVTEATAPVAGSAQDAASLLPAALPPLGEALPFTVVVVDDGGTAHLIDLATGATIEREIAVGSLRGETLTDVEGGAHGPIALRASLARYQLVDLDEPQPRTIDAGSIAAFDEDTGWYWFNRCTARPCDRLDALDGRGPAESERSSVDLPAPTSRVAAGGGYLYAEAAGTILRVEPATGAHEVVATGTLLDAHGTVIVLRSCATDLACPVYVVDTESGATLMQTAIEGDDIGLSPDGATLIAGARYPPNATVLAMVDVATGRWLSVDSDALRFVSVQFAWSPDGAWLFGATAGRSLIAVRVADGAIHRVDLPQVDRAVAGLLVRTTARD
jgi:hypothetical protein